jgi:hypothetical protein
MNRSERHRPEGIIVLSDIRHGGPGHYRSKQEHAGEKAVKVRGVFHFMFLSFPTLAVDVILKKTSSTSR